MLHIPSKDRSALMATPQNIKTEKSEGKIDLMTQKNKNESATTMENWGH